MLLKSKVQRMDKRVSNEEDFIISLFGDTGSGRSSLLCYLLDAPTEFEIRKGLCLLKHKPKQDPNYPTISNH